MTDLLSLVEPVRQLVPASAVPGRHPLAGLLESPGAATLATALVEQAPALVDAALTGTAGTVAVSRLGDAGRGAVELMQLSRDVEAVALEGVAAVERAAADITLIASDCVREVVTAVAVAPLSPATSTVALEIGCRHLARAHSRLDALGAELGELTARVESIDGVPSMPGTPPDHTVAQDSPTPTGSPTSGTGESDTADGDGASGTETAAVAGAPSPEAAAAVEAAQTELGTPYVWGGTTPGAGFDCSGFTQWAYAQAGVDIPRTADQQAVGPQVSADQLAPGDLAVWDGHVAMVTGDGQMIEAGDPVQVSPVRTENIGMNFLGFYRPTG